MVSRTSAAVRGSSHLTSDAASRYQASDLAPDEIQTLAAIVVSS